jgi:acyl-[acyl-carrier-protein] desaturase
VTKVVTEFQMPGHAIDGYLRKSVAIANAGIYDLRLHHDDVVSPILRYWGVFDLEGLSEEGDKARQELAQFMDTLDAAATRFEDRREERRARKAAAG